MWRPSKLADMIVEIFIIIFHLALLLLHLDCPDTSVREVDVGIRQQFQHNPTSLENNCTLIPNLVNLWYRYQIKRNKTDFN